MSARYTHKTHKKITLLATKYHHKLLILIFSIGVLFYVTPTLISFFYKEHVSLRGVVLSGGAVPAALQAGEGEHASTLRRATERLGLQLPAPAGLWGWRVGG